MRATGDADSPFWWHGMTADGEVHVAFTSVRAGNLARHVGEQQRDAVASRRRGLEAHMGVGSGTLRFLDQVHSALVLDAAEHPADSAHAPTGDAWISRGGAEPLAVMVADCLPVLLVGQGQGGEPLITGAAHAGREGLIGGVLENTVTAMREHGAESVQAWVGPGVCGSCYEVPAAMHEELGTVRPALASQTTWGTPALDLRSEAEEILRELGAGIAELAGCTLEDETLYSHRRAPGEGRFAGLVWRAR
ncbi:polyphenol oxidase family protein [Nesterenkonia sp. HG001]|uniref:polyphenol oxidase family protein n=1 Tax=Nesterenkonia sp. HG001 TaxID=2983207 RepID=UPI002ACC0A03|nr:laccase domain-containing protein [Nesterenkonia sp. HG001]